MLLLDEPAAGVPEGERHEILATVAALPRDVSVLLIEHDMDLVFSFADRISVLVNGAVLTEGTRRGDRDRSARAGGLSRGERRWLSCSTLDQVSAGYGEAVVISGIDLRLRAGRVARAARPQRHRQDDAAQHDRRRDAPSRRHHRARRPRHHRARRPEQRAPRPASAGCRRSATSSSR